MSWLKNKQWIPHRREMLESPAWQMLPLNARKILDAIELELIHHGGKDNGQLTVTYPGFAKYCTVKNRTAIAQAIREAEALGFLIITRGSGGVGKARLPNHYLLTYMPVQKNAAPDDNWTEIAPEEDARNRLAGVKKRRPQTNWFKAANVVDFLRKSAAT